MHAPQGSQLCCMVHKSCVRTTMIIQENETGSNDQSKVVAECFQPKILHSLHLHLFVHRQGRTPLFAALAACTIMA